MITTGALSSVTLSKLIDVSIGVLTAKSFFAFFVELQLANKSPHHDRCGKELGIHILLLI
ncbi:hypothetical protein JCM19274_3728 [Algibacter lectus]|uniref:Uncharacterized protein n=1 Tax=Algibacter lectus TaxID=221126 RepID=A0A090WV93_9FLAO|nr:hypothetical protein [Algibacter lectus]GAL80158.1 hypothetical protein JCM19274_3728 [Algibacter lectus]